MDSFRKDLILLNMVPGIGFIRLKLLLDEFNSPAGIFRASIGELKSVRGIGQHTARAIKNANSDYNIDKEIALMKNFGVGITTLFDDDYPLNLKNIYDPPILLYTKGVFKANDESAIAIVGSRMCTYYGINTADKMASELACRGITVVSGLARGIDTAAHKGALKGNGRTIAVLGNGLSFVYPAENKVLAEQVICNGAVVSEFPMETPPYKQNFPRRNRIISGLSKAVLVVEAARKSGALITADFALEQGRDVFAVPGMADRLLSTGTNTLIKQGAKLIDNVNDILEELVMPVASGITKKTGNQVLTEESQKNIYSMLSDNPCHVDAIMQGTGIKTKQVQSTLLGMQIKGFVKKLPGGFYIRNR
jgi:DNA processing protein